MAKTFVEVNDKRVEKVLEMLDVILKSARSHQIDNEELNDYLMPIVEHMGMKGATVKVYGEQPDDEEAYETWDPGTDIPKVPEVPVEQPQDTHVDQIRVSRWVYEIPGHTFKTVIAATMGRLNNGND